jgi:hypothetical protein
MAGKKRKGQGLTIRLSKRKSQKKKKTEPF